MVGVIQVSDGSPSVRSGRQSVVGADPARSMELAEEEQPVHLGQAPGDIPERDAAHEGGQVGGFITAEALPEEGAVDRSCRR